jgi:hypothetical protein
MQIFAYVVQKNKELQTKKLFTQVFFSVKSTAFSSPPKNSATDSHPFEPSQEIVILFLCPPHDPILDDQNQNFILTNEYFYAIIFIQSKPIYCTIFYNISFFFINFWIKNNQNKKTIVNWLNK